jgi:hypothetical protein
MLGILYYPNHRVRQKNPSPTRVVPLNSPQHDGEGTRISWNARKVAQVAYTLHQ